MAKNLNIGVIGAGRISRVHTPLLAQRVPGARVVKLCDLDLEKAHALGDALGIPVCQDFREIVNDPDIDAIFILTSTNAHVPITLEAAKAKKHIFCEKPIDHDADEIRRVIKAVEEAGVKFQVGFNRRFDRNFAQVRKSVAEGRVGDVHIIKITSRDPQAPPLNYVETSGGIFADMSIYDFDMVQFLSGAKVTEVSVFGANLINPEFAKYGDVDTCVISMKLDSGALAIINNSRQAVYGYDQRLEVFGSKGCVTADNEQSNNTMLFTADVVIQEKPLWFFLERYAEAFLYEDISFVESCVNDSPTLIDVRGGLSPILIADAAAKSCASGGIPVSVASE
ncbi:MAG: inositol 2-dehydrogenase [Eubacteriales bacterium]|nr:inositol 2-dehydrogenase [Eubacteriales bacterium]